MACNVRVFLPAIDAIKQHCDVMNVDAGVDYRLRTLARRICGFRHSTMKPGADG
ncbi:AFG1/ZapE family ATPase [Escherichia coli]